MSSLYDDDTYTWAMTQAEALRRRAGNELDWDNVAEEIESLGKSQATELRSRYVVLLTHLLKWFHQADRRSRSWETTIRLQRREIADHLDDNPGLKPRANELYERAFGTARIAAAGETDLPLAVFPETPPFTLEQAMDEAFFPEAPSASK